MTAPVAGIKALRRIQIGKETTPGSVAAATARLIGKLDMENQVKFYRPSDLETGRLSDFERSVAAGLLASLPFESDANYQQLGYLLLMALKGGVTPTGPSDSQYTWTFDPNLAAANAPTTYSIEYGDDIQAYISLFCFAKSLELSGQLDEAVRVKADIVGQDVNTATFTGALTNPTTLTPVLMNTAKLYIDATWAALGNTQKSATLIDFSWKTVAAQGGDGIVPVKYGDGGLIYTDRAEKKRHIELNVTFVHNSVTQGLFTAFKASPQTHSFVRLKFTGPLVGATSYNELILDGSFVIDTPWPKLEDRDGQDIVKLKMLSEYDVTGGKEWIVTLKNALSAMP